MAMLSEPRQRKRYNLVPKGKALFEDGERFGTKMLAKMGWSKGKGLGANEDGEQEFVRIRYKNDANGLGFEDRDDQWTEHEKHFNGLLENLKSQDSSASSSTGETSEVATPSVGLGFVSSTKGKLKDKFSGQSLEEKSKNSKARVHYKKFTRVKDMSQYSEKDLANIFGKKATPESTNIYDQFQVYNLKDEQKTVEPEKKKIELGCQTINTGVSVSDYFKLKMEALKAKREVIANGTNEKEVNGTEYESIINAKQETSEQTESEVVTLGSEEETGEKMVRPKKKKSKRKEKSEISDKDCKASDENLTPDVKEDVRTVEENILGENKDQDHSKEEVQHSDPYKIETENGKVLPTKKKSKKQNPEELTQESEENVGEIRSQKKKGKKKDKRQISIKDNAPVSESLDLVSFNEEAFPTVQENILNKPKQREHSEADIKNEEHQTQISGELDAKQIIERSEPLKEQDVLEANQIKKRKSDKDGDSSNQIQIKRKKTKNTTDDTLDQNSAGTQNLSRPVGKQNKTQKNKTSNSVEVSQPQEGSNLKNNYLIDTYKISTFCAEKFRTADLERYKGSTISQINGYGLSENLKLKIVEKANDKERILKLWNGVMDKYQYADPKQKIYNTYRKKVHIAKRAKTGIPKIKTKCLKRRQVFQPL